jgi:hypothetical protein
MMGQIQITEGHLIFNTENKSKDNHIADKVKDIFKVPEPIKDPENIKREETSTGRKPVGEITPQNLRHLESIDIKDHNWESIKLPTKTSDVLQDMKAIRPSRSEGETDNGGRSTLTSALNSIFNPEAVEGVKNSEFTDSVLQSGKDKKRESEQRRERSRDWEVETRAKTTKDLAAAQMGFTPNRSSFEPAPIPKVDLPVVEEIRAQNKKSADAGKEAAKIVKDLDSLFKVEYERDANDNRRWEDIEADKISKNQTRPLPEPEVIKIAEEVLKEKPDVSKMDLTGVFKMPQNPEEVKEENIKRDSSNLTTKRTKREDDRSWEVPSRSKKTW